MIKKPPSFPEKKNPGMINGIYRYRLVHIVIAVILAFVSMFRLKYQL
jgi:hypothetical protein